MLNKWLFFLMLGTVIGLSGPASAYNDDEVARLTGEIAEVRQNQRQLTEKIDQAGSRQQEFNLKQQADDVRAAANKGPGQDVEALRQEVAGIRSNLLQLNELKEFGSAQREKLRGSFRQLRAFSEQMGEIQKVNVVKTVLSMSLQTAQEVQAFATTSGKPVEIATWVADKLSGEVMKRTLDGSPEFYNRQIAGISRAAAAVTPEMDRLSNLASLSMEGWRSYFSKHEDKDIQGSSGLILGKGRVLAEQIEKAETSLLKLYQNIDRTVEDSANEYTRSQERLDALQAQLTELERPAAKGAGQHANEPTLGLGGLQERLRELQQEEARLLQLLTQAMQDLGKIDDEMAMAAHYIRLHSRLVDNQGRYEERVAEIQSRLADAARAMADVRTHEQQIDAEREAHLARYAGFPRYPGDSVDDTQGIANLQAYGEAEISLYAKQSAHHKLVVGQLRSANDTLHELWNRLPHDRNSSLELAKAVEDAYDHANAMLAEKVRPLRHLVFLGTLSAGQRPLLLQLEAKIREIGDLHGRPLPPSPYSRTVEWSAPEMPAVNGEVAVVFHEVSSLLAKEQVLQEEKLNRSEAMRAGLDATLPLEIAAATRQSRDNRQAYQASVQAALKLGRELAEQMDAYTTAMASLQADLRGLAAQGILKPGAQQAAGQATRFELDPAWVKKISTSGPADCRGVKRIHAELGSRDSAIAARRSAAERAYQLAQFGTFPSPNSSWSRINEPTLHDAITRAGARVAEALERSAAYGRIPPTDPVSGLLYRLPNDNLTLIDGFPDIFRGIQQSIRELTQLMRIAEGEVARAQGMDKVEKAWLDGLRGYPQRIDQAFDEQLGCLDPNHSLLRGMARQRDALAANIAQLGGKASYASAEALTGQMRKTLAGVVALAIGEGQGYVDQVNALVDQEKKGRAQFERQESDFSPTDVGTLKALLHEITERLASHREQVSRRSPAGASADAAGLQQLYADFSEAYARADLRALMALMASDWQGGDGTSRRELEDSLSNSFRVFDNLEFRIAGLAISPQATNGNVQVSYKLSISGKNSRRGLKHQENFDVVDEVGRINGKLLILRTLSGSLWLP